MVSGSALAATKPAVGAAKGFQMTEVGLIPDEWDVVRIGDIGTVGRGRVISHREILRSRNSLYPVYSSQTSNNGVMGYIDKFDFQGKYITWTTDGANAGTVFFRDGAFNCTNVCGTIKLDKHITEFVAIVLAKFAPKHVSRHLGNPKLMNDVMKKIQIPVPRNKNEQIAIAKSLNDTDELIDSLERLIAKKRQIKQGAMQELLTGKRRLAGFKGEWRKRCLGDLATMKSGEGITSAKIDNSSPYRCYGGNGLRGYTTEYNHDGRYALIGRVGALCGNINIADGRFFASEHAIVVYPKNDVVTDWLAYLLQFANLNRVSEASAQPVLTVSKLNKLEFQVPIDKLEQEAIARFITDLNDNIAEIEIQYQKTLEIKQGMMQDLLTGRIRLV